MRQLTKASTLLNRGRQIALAAAILSASSIAAANAGETVVFDAGVLNAGEYTYDSLQLKLAQHQLSDLECVYGYEFAKHGHHQEARKILNYCAGERHLTQSMTLLSWMDENGYGLDGPDLASAATWDRRAADLGDSNAQFNYGLKLLEGRGVAKNIAEGRRYIDQAAAKGDRAAQQLAAKSYDLSSVTRISEDRPHAGNDLLDMAKTN